MPASECPIFPSYFPLSPGGHFRPQSLTYILPHRATWFYQNGVAGACGTVHAETDNIIALDTALYGNTGVQSQYCGKSLIITNKSNGKTVTATVADACPTCESADSIDLSQGAFQALADLSVGEFDGT